MIKELNDLTHFIKTSVWRDEALLSDFSNGKPELLHLYRTVWRNTLNTDEAAARAAGWGLSAYKIYARQLRKCLRQMTVFFNDEKAGADATTNNQTEGILETAIMNLLHTRGYRHAPAAIAKRLYRRGRDYDAPVFAADALKVLKETAPDTPAGEKELSEYSRLYWEYRAYSDTEARAAECYHSASLAVLRRNTDRHQLMESVRQQLESLWPFKGRIPSYQFHLHYFTVQNQYLLEAGDFEGALRCCEEAIDWFSARPYPVAAPLALFHSAKVPACMLLGRFDAGEAAAITALDFAPDGSDYFFHASERYFYLAMYAGRYDQAMDVFHTATLHKRFSQLQVPLRENWHILGAYLFLACRLQRLMLPEKSLPSFKSYRFANETRTFNRDKAGMYVAILIAHVLMQLIEGRTDQLLERIQALDKYRERYLRATDSERSALFIRILALLSRVNFEAGAFRKKAAPSLRQLATLPRRLANPAYEVEIIPFETLAAMIADWLASGR